ncbi:hypothetical protein D3C78_1221740 [compost metagenome]
MLSTFADGIYILHGSLQIIIHHDPTIYGDSAIFCQCHVRFDSNSHYHKICSKRTVITKTQSTYSLFPAQFYRLFAHSKFHALTLQLSLQHRGGIPIKLTLHQIFHQMNYGNIHTKVHKTFCRFQPK